MQNYVNEINFQTTIFNTISYNPKQIPNQIFSEKISQNMILFSMINSIDPPPSFKSDHDLIKTIIAFHIYNMQSYIRKDYNDTIFSNARLKNIYLGKVVYFQLYLKNKIKEV